MNFLRVRLNHGDILTFMMRQRFIMVVVRSMLYHHIDDCLRLNGCLVMVREVIQGQRTQNQMHNAHTSHALEDILQSY